jgi:hypothetical protein
LKPFDIPLSLLKIFSNKFTRQIDCRVRPYYCLKTVSIMAIVSSNPIINGLSGMLGRTVVFKTLRGKTIMANRPCSPKTQSAEQKANRSKFKDASAYAKAAMLDPAKKEYYWKKAKKMKLPNAYTAAITDYMRKPTVTVIHKNKNGGVTAVIDKKDFQLKKATLYQKTEAAPVLLRAIPCDGSTAEMQLTRHEIETGILFSIESEFRQTWVEGSGVIG